MHFLMSVYSVYIEMSASRSFFFSDNICSILFSLCYCFKGTRFRHDFPCFRFCSKPFITASRYFLHHRRFWGFFFYLVIFEFSGFRTDLLSFRFCLTTISHPKSLSFLPQLFKMFKVVQDHTLRFIHR